MYAVDSSHLLLLDPDKVHFTDLMFQREAADPVTPEGRQQSIWKYFFFFFPEGLCFFLFFFVCVFFVSYHPAWNQLSYFHTENCTIIFQIRQIILLSIRLDKGDFSNYELLLCKLILRQHQGSISPAIFPLNLRGGSAGGSLTIITLIGLGSLHQNSLISLTPCHNSTEWLIEDMNWIDVGGEYEIVGIIQILKMVLPIVFFPASTLKPTELWSNKGAI